MMMDAIAEQALRSHKDRMVRAMTLIGLRPGDRVRVHQPPSHVSRVERHGMQGKPGRVRAIDLPRACAKVEMLEPCNAFGVQTYWIHFDGLERIA